MAVDEPLEEVAIFIDFENLRYSMLNSCGQEPDIRAIVSKAKTYGRPTRMKAYADFAEHPKEVRDSLHTAGIEAINVPVTRRVQERSGHRVERIKNAADMHLALDAVTEALEADRGRKRKTFLLVTGDRDYVKLVTHLRNIFGQRVVIAGVPGSVASDLVAAADRDDPIAVVPAEPVDPLELKTVLVRMVDRGPHPLRYWTFRTIDQWAQDGRQRIPGTAREKRDAIGELAREGVLVRSEIEDEVGRRRVQAVHLDRERAGARGYL